MLHELAKTHPDVMKADGKGPVVGLVSPVDGVFEFRVFFWVEDFMTSWRAVHELREETIRRFSEEEVDFALPQAAVIMRQSFK